MKKINDPGREDFRKGFTARRVIIKEATHTIIINTIMPLRIGANEFA